MFEHHHDKSTISGYHSVSVSLQLSRGFSWNLLWDPSNMGETLCVAIIPFVLQLANVNMVGVKCHQPICQQADSRRILALFWKDGLVLKFLQLSSVAGVHSFRRLVIW